MKKTEGGVITVYPNKYYEKNLTSGEVTTHYYLGDKEVALKKGSTVRYVSQDHLTGTAVTSDTAGTLVGRITYLPYGLTRATSGTIDTDKKFTGQRLDATGLYYYGARYYDASIGRFISPDSIVPSSMNPQAMNRYSYVLNNPLKYVDPTGYAPLDEDVPGLDYLYDPVGDLLDKLGYEGPGTLEGAQEWMEGLLLDKEVRFAGWFRTYRGGASGEGWLNNLLNALLNFGDIFLSLGGGRVGAETLGDFKVTGTARVYHRSSGGTWIELDIFSGKESLAFTVTLYWTTATGEQRMPMTQVSKDKGQREFLARAEPRFWDERLLGYSPFIPNFSDPNLQSMWIDIRPAVAEPGTSWTRPAALTVSVK